MKLYSLLERRKATPKTKISLDAARLGDVENESVAEMNSELKALLESTVGDELADAVTERCNVMYHRQLR